MNKNKEFPKKKVAIIAGNGSLPLFVAEELTRLNSNFIIVCFDKTNQLHFINNLSIKPELIFPADLSNITNILSILKEHKIQQVVCCGGVKFKSLENLHLLSFRSIIRNLKLIKYMVRAYLSKQKGDNFLLTLVEKILSKIGCQVVPVQEILPNLLCCKDDEINIKLATKYQQSIDFGVNILDTLAEYDIGQSIVVHNGRVLGIEGYEGTQELIKRCSKYYQEINKKSQSNDIKPILIKKSKIGQNRKLDIPTIGEQTILDLISGNFAGLVIEDNGVFILDREKIFELCKKYKLFLMIK